MTCVCVCSTSHGEQMEVKTLVNKERSRLTCWEPITKCRHHSCSELTFKLADHFSPHSLSLLSLLPPQCLSSFFSLSPGDESVKTYWRTSSLRMANRKFHLPYFNPPVIMSRAERVLSKLNSGSINKPLCPLLALIRC